MFAVIIFECKVYVINCATAPVELFIGAGSDVVEYVASYGQAIAIAKNLEHRWEVMKKASDVLSAKLRGLISIGEAFDRMVDIII